MTTPTTWYRTGTVSVTAGSKSVTGAGTLWLSQSQAGDMIALADANGNLVTALAEVESVTSDTALTLKSIWPGSTQADQKYALIRNFTGTLPADLAARLSKLIAQYQISADELVALLSTAGPVTLTTLTGEAIQTMGLLSYSNAVPDHDASDSAHGMSATGRAVLRGDAATGRGALGLANHNLMMVDSGGNATFPGKVSATAVGTAAYGLQALGAAGGARSIFLAGQIGYSNGFSVDYTGSAMLYRMQDGPLILGAAANDGVNQMQVGGSGKYNGTLTATAKMISGGGMFTYGAGSDTPNAAGPGAAYSVDANGNATVYKAFWWQLDANNRAKLFIGNGSNAWVDALTVDTVGRLFSGTASYGGYSASLNVAVGGATFTAHFMAANGNTLQVWGTGLATNSFNGADSVTYVSKQTTTGRSINAAGTVNASGNDYAEYERNNGLSISKGSVIGFKADGTLTLTYADAVRFGVKSTDPSYVGGDIWGSEEIVGKRPEQPQFVAPEYAGSERPADLPAAPVEPVLSLPAEPIQQDGEPDEVFAARSAWWQQACQAATAQYEQALAAYRESVTAYQAAQAEYQAALAQYELDQAEYAQALAAEQEEFDEVMMPAYQAELAAWEARLEAERQKVDRIAYSGKVPVNVWGATPGGYIIVAAAEDGSIIGEFVADPDFAQYKRAVGRVNRILPDGRAEVAVMVH